MNNWTKDKLKQIDILPDYMEEIFKIKDNLFELKDEEAKKEKEFNADALQDGFITREELGITPEEREAVFGLDSYQKWIDKYRLEKSLGGNTKTAKLEDFH